jgi:hypothetical protein
MPGEKLMANYNSENGEHYMGIPAKDLYESDWNRLSDDQKELVKASSFYHVRGEGAEKAKAVEKAEPVAEMPADAPKAEAKK